MLREWTAHAVYQEGLKIRLVDHFFCQKSRVVALDKSISKLYLLNLDPLLPVVKPLYPEIGRPAKNQQGIIRSLVLMLDQQEYSITKWALRVASDRLLFDLCGFFGRAPAVASYYDFLVRLWLADFNSHLRRKKKLKWFCSKPRKKLKAGEKLPPKRSGTVKRLVDRALEGKLKSLNPQAVLQQLLARCVVDTSAQMGLLGDGDALAAAFDGTTFTREQALMESRFVIAVQKEVISVSARAISLTLTPDGGGTAIARSGFSAIPFSMSPPPTALTICLFISKWFRPAAMTVLRQSLPCRISETFTRHLP